jgi:hypothetical protein
MRALALAAIGSRLQNLVNLIFMAILGLQLVGCSRTSPNSASDVRVGACVASGRGHFERVQRAIVTMPISADSVWLSVAHLERANVLKELSLGLQDAGTALYEVVIQLMPATSKPVDSRSAAHKPADI